MDVWVPFQNLLPTLDDQKEVREQHSINRRSRSSYEDGWQSVTAAAREKLEKYEPVVGFLSAGDPWTPETTTGPPSAYRSRLPPREIRSDPAVRLWGH
ncbi:hypothetical protein J6590_006792 [Homalodisca vitripennis]|nr:hypothetical protein J6590_006792 [Homalodisca vitripennis]